MPEVKVLEMFSNLESLVNNNMDQNLTTLSDVKVTTDGLDDRVKTLEEQIKNLSAPTGDGGLGLIAEELNQKIASLEKRVTVCEGTDERQ